MDAMALFPLLFAMAATTSDPHREVVEALFASMKATYVFPEVAVRAEADIRRRFEAGDYDSLDDAGFARRLTEDLKTTCHDAHLGVHYSSDAIPFTNGEKPSPRERARERAFLAHENGAFRKAERLAGNVGFLKFDGFAPEWAAKAPLRAAMAFLADTEALIVDLRENGGGEPETVRLACSYLFRDRVHLNDLWYRKGPRTEEYWTKPVPGPRYLDKPVYVLVGPHTASAAEEFAYDLQTLGRATVVGDRTWGGANPGDEVRLSDHFSAFIPNARAVNPITKTNWEGQGVSPDVAAPDALATAHRLAIGRLLQQTKDAEVRAALQRILDRLPVR